MTTGWGYFQQGSEQLQEIMELGGELSQVIHCPVHYPAFGKRLFECKCGILFPAWLVSTKDWPTIRKLHTPTPQAG